MTRDLAVLRFLRRGARALPCARRVGVASALASIAALALSGCTSAQLQGDSPSYLIIDSVEGASGATPSQFGDTLGSDTVTMVKQQDASGQTVLVPTIYEDPGEATFELALKDPGSAESPSTPTSANAITITRYHVNYVRADGQNTPGVDVPYPFDGAMTVTIGSQSATGTFTLVRSQAKQEAPLQALDTNGSTISTIAQVTFYGTDQAGHAVSATGQIGVNFSNWGDPQ